MPTAVATIGFNNDAFQAFIAARREPAWLEALRREAFAKFQELPWPHAGMEEWRRTDIRTFRLAKFAPPSAHRAGDVQRPVALLSAGVELAGSTTAYNSQPGEATLDPELSKRGVIFGSLDRLAVEHADLVRKYLLTRAVDPSYDALAALHAAFWSGGTLLYVPRGVTIEKPLHVLTAIGDGGVDFSHTLVVLEEDAEATVLGETAGGGNGGFHCGAVELIVGPRARLRYVNLQNWERTVWHFAHHKALVEQDGRIQWTIGALGSKLSKVNQHVALVGPGAEAQVNGVMFTEGRQHINYHTLQHHEAPSCKSDLLYKGALQDQSRVVWRGMIKVDAGAQKTDGYQRNDNLMLSDHARADSIPGLEIEADDVRCTHGATTGRVDDETIFYLRSRGLTRKEATRMIVSGFFQQVFDRITIESVREALGQAIGRRIREYA
jgi:Fe-S cluster assembly protein SufD